MTKRVSPSCPPHDARNLRDKHPELKQKISELQNEIDQLQQGHSNAESNLKALTVLFAVKMRARLKVHSFIKYSDLRSSYSRKSIEWKDS